MKNVIATLFVLVGIAWIALEISNTVSARVGRGGSCSSCAGGSCNVQSFPTTMPASVPAETSTVSSPRLDWTPTNTTPHRCECGCEVTGQCKCPNCSVGCGFIASATKGAIPPAKVEAPPAFTMAGESYEESGQRAERRQPVRRVLGFFFRRR